MKLMSIYLSSDIIDATFVSRDHIFNIDKGIL